MITDQNKIVRCWSSLLCWKWLPSDENRALIRSHDDKAKSLEIDHLLVFNWSKRCCDIWDGIVEIMMTKYRITSLSLSLTLFTRSDQGSMNCMGVESASRTDCFLRWCVTKLFADQFDEILVQSRCFFSSSSSCWQLRNRTKNFRKKDFFFSFSGTKDRFFSSSREQDVNQYREEMDWKDGWDSFLFTFFLPLFLNRTII